MKRSARSIGLMIHPASYPLARLVWTQEICDEDHRFGRTISLDCDFWLDFARTCKLAADRIKEDPSGTLAIALSVISNMITDGIASKVRREKNSEIYASFLDFVVAVMRRTDLDRARKGQMIHDKAPQIKLL